MDHSIKCGQNHIGRLEGRQIIPVHVFQTIVWVISFVQRESYSDVRKYSARRLWSISFTNKQTIPHVDHKQKQLILELFLMSQVKGCFPTYKMDPFRITFYVLSALVATTLATVTDVQNDIQNITTQTQTLDTTITGFPDTGGSIATALDIHTDAVNLGQAIDKGTTDIEAVTGTISESDGQNLLNGVVGVQPTILDSLTQIVAKKPAFAGLPIGGIPALVLQDLQNLNASTSAFEAALIAAAPADLQAQATAIKSAVDAAFATAIASYSS